MNDEAKPHILVVEDDQSLADWIGDYLLENNFDISIANRGSRRFHCLTVQYKLNDLHMNQLPTIFL